MKKRKLVQNTTEALRMQSEHEQLAQLAFDIMVYGRPSYWVNLGKLLQQTGRGFTLADGTVVSSFADVLCLYEENGGNLNFHFCLLLNTYEVQMPDGRVLKSGATCSCTNRDDSYCVLHDVVSDVVVGQYVLLSLLPEEKRQERHQNYLNEQQRRKTKICTQQQIKRQQDKNYKRQQRRAREDQQKAALRQCTKRRMKR